MIPPLVARASIPNLLPPLEARALIPKLIPPLEARALIPNLCSAMPRTADALVPKLFRLGAPKVFWPELATPYRNLACGAKPLQVTVHV